eukprot:5172393-Pyramimonas_sp.AAC.1
MTRGRDATAAEGRAGTVRAGRGRRERPRMGSGGEGRRGGLGTPLTLAVRVGCVPSLAPWKRAAAEYDDDVDDADD